MNCLILGGNGYLGSKIVHSLLNEGNTVICTKRESSDLSRLLDVIDRVEWISTSFVEIEQAFSKYQIDYIINLACNYGKNNEEDSKIIESNLYFPLNVIELGIKYSVKNFLSIGTSLPDYFNMYSFSKKILADFGYYYSKKYDICFNSVVLEMYYGYDEPLDRFLPSIIYKMLKGEPVYTTTGIQKRDIVSVSDVVKAISLIMQSNISGYNNIPVGTGEAPTVSDIVDYLWKITGNKSDIHKGYIQMRKNEPLECVADVSIINSLGVWNPIHWKDGLLNMVIKMKENV